MFREHRVTLWSGKQTDRVTLKIRSKRTQRNTEIPSGDMIAISTRIVSVIPPQTTKQSKRLKRDTKYACRPRLYIFTSISQVNIASSTLLATSVGQVGHYNDTEAASPPRRGAVLPRFTHPAPPWATRTGCSAQRRWWACWGTRGWSPANRSSPTSRLLGTSCGRTGSSGASADCEVQEQSGSPFKFLNGLTLETVLPLDHCGTLGDMQELQETSSSS